MPLRGEQCEIAGNATGSGCLSQSRVAQRLRGGTERHAAVESFEYAPGQLLPSMNASGQSCARVRMHASLLCAPLAASPLAGGDALCRHPLGSEAARSAANRGAAQPLEGSDEQPLEAARSDEQPRRSAAQPHRSAAQLAKAAGYALIAPLLHPFAPLLHPFSIPLAIGR